MHASSIDCKMLDTIGNMGTRGIERGPVAEQVSRNVAALRTKRGMSLEQLSGEMRKLGRPILASGLSKIETGERRVDADDLVALAVALDVSPSRLLLPVERPEPLSGADVTWEDMQRHGKVQLTPATTVPWAEAWAWAYGERPLSGVDMLGEWREENHPHEEIRLAPQELQRVRNQAKETATALRKALRALADAGLDPGTTDVPGRAENTHTASEGGIDG